MGIDMSSARMVVSKGMYRWVRFGRLNDQPGGELNRHSCVKSLCGIEPSPRASTKLRRAFDGQFNHVRDLCSLVSNRMFDSDVPHQLCRIIGFCGLKRRCQNITSR